MQSYSDNWKHRAKDFLSHDCWIKRGIQQYCGFNKSAQDWLGENDVTERWSVSLSEMGSEGSQYYMLPIHKLRSSKQVREESTTYKSFSFIEPPKTTDSFTLGSVRRFLSLMKCFSLTILATVFDSWGFSPNIFLIQSFINVT